MRDTPASLKFYMDTHIAKAVAEQLRNQGVDVIRCEEVGMAEASDIEHLEYAKQQGRVMVSHDEDFLILNNQWHNEGKAHAGIMFVHPHLQGKSNVGRIVKGLYSYYELIVGGAGTVQEDIYNQVIYIS